MLSIFAIPVDASSRAPANHVLHDTLYFGTVVSPSSVQAFCLTVPDYYFTAVAIRPLSGQNLDLDLYSNFDPGTNTFSGWMNTSDRGAGLVDLIVIDAVNQPVNPTLYANVRYTSGSFPNSYAIEVDGAWCENYSHEDYNEYKYRDYANTTYSKTMHAGEIIDTCEFYLSKGMTYNISLPVTPAGASYRLYTFPTFGELSDPNGYGASGDQATPMMFTPSRSGYHCIVIVNENNVAGDYSLLVKAASPYSLVNNVSVQKKFANDGYQDPALFEFDAPANAFTAVAFKPASTDLLELSVYSDAGLQNMVANSYEPTGKFSIAIVDRSSASQNARYSAVLTDWIEYGQNYRIEADSSRELLTNVSFMSYWTSNNLFDVYRTYMYAGFEYNISMPSEPATARYGIYLFNASGSLGSNLSSGTDDIPILFTPDDSGYYAIVVVNENAVGGTYTLLCAMPSFTMNATNTTITNMPGGLNMTTLALAPTFGFSSPISLSSTGVPSGVIVDFSSNPAAVPSTVTAYFTIDSSAPTGTYQITIEGSSGAVSREVEVTLVITNFSLQISPAIQTVTPGGGTTYTINVIGDGAGVTLSYIFSPNGPYGSFSPNPVTPGNSSTFTVNTPGTITAGSYQFTVTATRAWMVKSAYGQLDVTSDFMISANPAALSIAPGSSDGSTIFVSGSGLAVTLSASCTEPTITASISPTTVMPGGSTSITIDVQSSTPQGTYLVNISGTRGAITHYAHITVNVMPDFSISVTPSNAEMNPGGSVQFTVVLSGAGDPAYLSASSMQPTLGFSFSPGMVNIGEQSTLTVSSTTGTPIGSYQVNVVAERGTQSRSAIVSAAVVSLSDFSIAASPSSRSVSAGMQTSFSVSVTGVGAFSSVVLLSVSGAPGGMPISFNPLSIYPGSSSTMTIQTSALTTPGTYTLTITGTGGGKSHSTTVQLAVTAQSVLAAKIDSITPSPASQGEVVTLTGHGEGGSGTYIDYSWKSSIDGYLGNSATLSTSALSLGNHTIMFMVKDNSGSNAWSPEETANLEVRLSPNGPVVRVISPNGGEVWSGTNEITWQAAPHVAGATISVALYYSSDGVAWNLLSANEQNDGKYSFDTTKVMNGNGYKIKAIASENGVLGIDESDGTFTISNTGTNTAPNVALAFPDNNAVVTTTSPSLSWSGSDADGDRLTYDVYLDSLDASKQVARGISSPVYTAQGLVSGVSYKWRVVPFDGKTYGNCVSGTYRFLVNTASPNYPPSMTQWFPAVSSQTAEEGAQINFSAVASDPDGDSLSHQWYVNGALVYGKSNSPDSNYAFMTNSTSAGNYNVTVYIFDGHGNAVYKIWSVTITDKNTNPIPLISSPVAGATFDFGAEVTFEGGASYDPDGDTTSLTWRLGDTDIGTGATLRISTLPPGENVVTLVVKDSKGGSASTTVTITIKDRPKAVVSLLGIESTGEKKINAENVISVRVSNEAQVDSSPFALRMTVNGERYDDKQITLRKGESGKVDFIWVPENDGEYTISVELSPSSDITIKNGRVQMKLVIAPEERDLSFLWLIVIIILLGIIVTGAFIVKSRSDRQREALYGPPHSQLGYGNVRANEGKEAFQPDVKFSIEDSHPGGPEAPIFARFNAQNDGYGAVGAQGRALEGMQVSSEGRVTETEPTEKPKTMVLRPRAPDRTSPPRYRSKMPPNYSKAGPSASEGTLPGGAPSASATAVDVKHGEIRAPQGKHDYLPEQQGEIQMIRPSELGLEDKGAGPKPTSVRAVESAVCSSCGEEIFDGGTLCPKCEVTDLMLSAERLIAGTKGTGIETQRAEELVERARTAFKMAKFEEVKSIVSELTAITRSSRELGDTLLKYQLKINELESSGKDVKELKSSLLLIKSFIQSGNHEKARAYIDKFDSTIAEIERAGVPAYTPPVQTAPEKSAEAQNVKCSVCGMKVMSNWDACPYCNTKIAPPVQTLPSKKGSRCIKCGNDVQPDWDICPFCSALLSKGPDGKCPVCERVVEPSASMCPHCFAKLR